MDSDQVPEATARCSLESSYPDQGIHLYPTWSSQPKPLFFLLNDQFLYLEEHSYSGNIITRYHSRLVLDTLSVKFTLSKSRTRD